MEKLLDDIASCIDSAQSNNKSLVKFNIRKEHVQSVIDDLLIGGYNIGINEFDEQEYELVISW